MFARLFTYRMAVLVLVLLAPALCRTQAMGSGAFREAQPDPGWTLSGSASLTGGAGDPQGQGWLRLTGAEHNALGIARFEGPPFDATRGVSLSFDYVSWGGGSPGADGLSVFLYEPAGNMADAAPGGGLGYCRGAGGWLALGLDEYGNFSSPQDACASGPGRKPQSVVVRGPVSAGHPLVAQVEMAGGVDRATAAERPAPSRILMRLAPLEPEPGFRITIDAETGSVWTRLVDGAPFPHPAPARLRLGIAGSTGGLRNIHEVRDVVMQPFIAARVRHGFQPGSVKVGEGVTLSLALSSLGGTVRLVRPVTVALPPGLRLSSPAAWRGNCRGKVTAAAKAERIVIEAGTTLSAEPCALFFELLAVSAGRWAHEIPAGSVVTDWGLNTAPSAANVIVH